MSSYGELLSIIPKIFMYVDVKKVLTYTYLSLTKWWYLIPGGNEELCGNEVHQE